MTIRPIPLDGLHIIKQFVAARRFMVFDQEADKVMNLVVELVNQIQHQHDEPVPSSQDPVSVPSGTCPGCSFCQPEKQRALDAQYLEIVQLREMVQIRDERINELRFSYDPTAKQRMADLAEENEKLKEELESEKEHTADQARALDNRNAQIKDMSANIWEWRNVPHHEKVFKLANDLKDAKAAIELRDANIAALRDQLRTSSNQYAIELEKIKVANSSKVAMKLLEDIGRRRTLIRDLTDVCERAKKEW